MKFLKNNVKLFIGIIIGIFLASGTILAYSYYANDISYTKQGIANEITVSDALDDLYSKVPSGSKTIESTGSFDVSQYATAVVQNLYTTTQYNNNYTTGYNAGLSESKGKRWNSGSFNTTGIYNIPTGFRPSKIIVYTNGTSESMYVYDSAVSSSQFVKVGIGNDSNPYYTYYNLGDTISNTRINSISDTQVQFNNPKGSLYRWFAVE